MAQGPVVLKVGHVLDGTGKDLHTTTILVNGGAIRSIGSTYPPAERRSTFPK